MEKRLLRSTGSRWGSQYSQGRVLGECRQELVIETR